MRPKKALLFKCTLIWMLRSELNNGHDTYFSENEGIGMDVKGIAKLSTANQLGVDLRPHCKSHN